MKGLMRMDSLFEYVSIFMFIFFRFTYLNLYVPFFCLRVCMFITCHACLGPVEARRGKFLELELRVLVD